MRIFKEYKSIAAGAAVWAGIFLIEALLARWETAGEEFLVFRSHYLTKFLLPTLPFLAVFCIHDLFLAPMLIRRKRLVTYLLCTVALMGTFSFYILDSERSPGRKPEPMERPGQHPHQPHGFPDGRGPSAEKGEPRLGPGENAPDIEDFEVPPEIKDRGGLQERAHAEPPRAEPVKKPFGAGVSKIVIALMMLGVNLGAKYYSNHSFEKKRLEELEKENLRYRLEYLRSQINPHFFMNTLNNIHALVDDSPEKAKESIVELSRLMRHVLYDSNGPTVRLSKEIDFLRHYLYLMRLRYTDNVRVEYSFPDDDGGIEVPPLLMATIAENAFKHGVSYKSESYVRLSVALDSGRVIFRCANSLNPAEDVKTSGGVGLDNIQKRLSLLYGNDFVLHIDKSAAGYEVLMVLPSKPVAVC